MQRLVPLLVWCGFAGWMIWKLASREAWGLVAFVLLVTTGFIWKLNSRG